MTAPTTNTGPLACDVTALPVSERDAHFALAQELFTQHVLAVTELTDGYSFQFAADQYHRVCAFVANERQCCPFIAFRIDVPPQHAAMWLHLTGGEPVKAFLRTEFHRLQDVP